MKSLDQPAGRAGGHSSPSLADWPSPVRSFKCFGFLVWFSFSFVAGCLSQFRFFLLLPCPAWLWACQSGWRRVAWAFSSYRLAGTGWVSQPDCCLQLDRPANLAGQGTRRKNMIWLRQPGTKLKENHTKSFKNLKDLTGLGRPAGRAGGLQLPQPG